MTSRFTIRFIMYIFQLFLFPGLEADKTYKVTITTCVDDTTIAVHKAASSTFRTLEGGNEFFWTMVTLSTYFSGQKS